MDKLDEFDAIGGMIPVTIDLGALELKISDLFALRPGSYINFIKPELFEVALRIGSKAWADAELRLEGEEIVIKVKKVIPLQETLSQ